MLGRHLVDRPGLPGSAGGFLPLGQMANGPAVSLEAEAAKVFSQAMPDREIWRKGSRALTLERWTSTAGSATAFSGPEWRRWWSVGGRIDDDAIHSAVSLLDLVHNGPSWLDWNSSTSTPYSAAEARNEVLQCGEILTAIDFRPRIPSRFRLGPLITRQFHSASLLMISSAVSLRCAVVVHRQVGQFFIERGPPVVQLLHRVA